MYTMMKNSLGRNVAMLGISEEDPESIDPASLVSLRP
jgi:hypothetical protein